MVQSVEGVYRNGQVELLEPAPTSDETRVIVTFLANGSEVDLKERGIDPEQAADLRARLRSFDEDWRRPEMDAYDAL
jgi:hypothetical protein